MLRQAESHFPTCLIPEDNEGYFRELQVESSGFYQNCEGAPIARIFLQDEAKAIHLVYLY